MQGNFLKVFNTYLVGINQVNGFKTHNELTMYPLGNYPLAPSDPGWEGRIWHAYDGVNKGNEAYSNCLGEALCDVWAQTTKGMFLWNEQLSIIDKGAV